MKSLAKTLPDPGNYSILPPDMDYLYFQGIDRFPLQAGLEEYHPCNAWWMSECAFLAYSHPGFARMAFKLAGFPDFRFFQGKGTECMVAWNKKHLLVSFRGTEIISLSTFHEIITDLNAIPVPFERGGKVHKGFLQGLGEIWSGPEGLESFLKERIEERPRREIFMTGHSLGGALASLCFSSIPEAACLYIFGSPRIGDQDFVDLNRDRPVFRIENHGDPIPTVPPDLPALNFNFKDLGELYFLHRDGNIVHERPQFSLEEQKQIVEKGIEKKSKENRKIAKNILEAGLAKLEPKKVLEEVNEQVKKNFDDWKDYLSGLSKEYSWNAADHMPVFYCTKLWNLMVGENSC